MALLHLISRLALICGVLLPAGGCESQPSEPASTPDAQSATAAAKPGATAQATATASSTVKAKPAEFQIVRSYPHDRNAFTQGLLWHNGYLYESTGREGRSTVRRVELATGRVLLQTRQPNDVFGEGLARVDDRLVQLSWKNGRAFVYDLSSLEKVGEWSYQGQGWGLTFDGDSLIMSDGSANLTWRNAKSFVEEKRLPITLNGKPLDGLNELEWIDGEIWANVWQTDYIVRIDPQTGAVRSFLDLSGLLNRQSRTGREDVLNGIAYDSANKRLFITGKLWPRLFEIKLLDEKP